MADHWYRAPRAADVVPELLSAFEAAYGRAADGVWSAPGRVNLIGEHVDYNGGLCLPLALPHRTFAAVAARDDGRVRVRSRQEPSGWEGPLSAVAPGTAQSPVQSTVPGWAGYAVGVPWALDSLGAGPIHGFDALIDGRVPLGAGLSSSAALECAVAVAVDELDGLGLAPADAGRARLAQACVRAEREIAGAPTGGLDQAAALRSMPGHALLIDCRDFTVEHVPLPPPGHGLEFLVIDTRARHALVDGQYGSARDACEEAARALGVPLLGLIAPGELDDALRTLAPHGDELVRRTRHVVTEIQRVREAAEILRSGAVRSGDVRSGDVRSGDVRSGDLRSGVLRSGDPDAAIARLGHLFEESHRSMRDDFRISCAELDVACAAAVGAGALGARMTGGGFGGSAVALVHRERREAVAAAVAEAFAGNGFAPPRFLEVTESAPAGRDA